MALPLQEHPLELAGPPVNLKSSNPSVVTRETRDESSSPLGARAWMLDVRESQSLERAPQASFVTSLGFPSFFKLLVDSNTKSPTL